MDTAVAINLLLTLIDRAAAWSAVIGKARAEGREITKEELDAFAQADDLARQGLVEAIAKARQSP